MAQTNWLKTLKSTFPDLTFARDTTFRWSPHAQTVYVGALESEADLKTLLHETGHALAGHRAYEQDIQLVKMEREAWQVAKLRLAPLFGIEIHDETIEEALDSYRAWLHARSRCPDCGQTGIQKDETHYECLLCAGTWRVNDARICQLRRYRITK